MAASYYLINKCNQKVRQVKNKITQELGDDISVCVLNILPKVSSLPSLLAINLVKVEMQIFQTVM